MLQMLAVLRTDIGFHDGFEYRIFKLMDRNFYYLLGYLFTFDGGYLFFGLWFAPPASILANGTVGELPPHPA